VKSSGESTTIEFENAVIAVGSRPVKLPFLPSDDSRIWDSTDALALPFIPKRLSVLGGGIIGLEMAQVYSALGSEITIIEMLDQIIPPADPDLVRPLQTKLKKTVCRSLHFDKTDRGRSRQGRPEHLPGRR
jgi:dihydrolipoamide dehydrogenase